MVHFFEPLENPAPLSLHEFVREIDQISDIDSAESLLKARPLLQRLASDQHLIPDLLAADLLGSDAFQMTNGSTGQIFVLYECPSYFVRANIWVPRSWDSVAAREDRLFAYDCLHDHNFHLLTVGYCGSGYETDIHTYDPAAVTGVRGESVALREGERLRLGKGCALLMEKSRHVHIQHPPCDFSISLNLIPIPQDRSKHAQLIFSLRGGGQVTQFAESAAAHTCFLLDTVGAIGADPKSVDMVTQILKTATSLPVRLYALRTLARLVGHEAAFASASSGAIKGDLRSQYTGFLHFQEPSLFY